MDQPNNEISLARPQLVLRTGVPLHSYHKVTVSWAGPAL